ncbi:MULTISPECIES: tyrosine-type recombinase/integrase [Nocardiopsis]|uniref:Integrase family protein n=3 Tax=Nocardiopsis dassonvillei TaxID=2014 RepID=D7AUN6_NOCDD|nr:tyrosine-type recombinase/integrase [Nocardiopsis dassonvillei]ADH67616.1 integrase family protein [Nocardiopsis dassonvillei subsp. dassonvillei DSM 43111]APC35802.1 integrase [Nocardiopsis dassonvillei]NKY81933.1 tyrosine-type recombinase/integrase [Nocardiopsis dassonvillei]VEI87983.1 Tyrosine recombinase XerD [Nocardiopsis dassonvillei]
MSAQTGPVAEAVEQYLVARRAAKPSPHTVAAYRRDLRGVLGCVAQVMGVEPEQVEWQDLEAGVLRAAFAEFAGERAASSVVRAWSTWNGFFGFWVSEGVVAGNPMSAVPRPRVRPSGPKPLMGEDTPERLLEALARGARKARDPWPERDLAVLALALLTGMRSAEMLSLRVESVGGRSGERRIRVVGKGGGERVLPIEVPLEALLEAYLVSRRERFGVVRGSDPLLVDNRGEGLRRGGLQYLVQQCYKHAGVHDRVARGTLVHALRHTFATRLAEDGASVSEIMHLLGHASVASSQAYIEVTARAQREAASSNRTYGVLRRLVAEGGGG